MSDIADVIAEAKENTRRAADVMAEAASLIRQYDEAVTEMDNAIPNSRKYWDAYRRLLELRDRKGLK